ncbi:MAG: class I SAM-dependent methyltransferase, partial [Blastocatellia bacterium]
YDLYLVPGWCEFFDRMIEEEVRLPKEGRILDLACGSGGLAIDLALRGSEGREVVGVDADPALVALAEGKAGIRQASRLQFLAGSLGTLALDRESFDVVIADFSLIPWRPAPCEVRDLLPLARKGATLVLKLATRGSFDEFFSLYWEALYDLGLTDLSPRLEALIESRLSVAEAERIAQEAGWRRVHSLLRTERLEFPDAASFFSSPVICTAFLDSWLAILPEATTRQAMVDQLSQILDRERQGASFDLSIKTTLLLGQK